jgi:hypothetical protein
VLDVAKPAAVPALLFGGVVAFRRADVDALELSGDPVSPAKDLYELGHGLPRHHSSPKPLGRTTEAT